MKYLILLICLCLLAGCQYKESPIKDYGVYVEIENPEPEEIDERFNRVMAMDLDIDPILHSSADLGYTYCEVGKTRKELHQDMISNDILGYPEPEEITQELQTINPEPIDTSNWTITTEPPERQESTGILILSKDFPDFDYKTPNIHIVIPDINDLTYEETRNWVLFMTFYEQYKWMDTKIADKAIRKLLPRWEIMAEELK
jgi:hypothetical protein